LYPSPGSGKSSLLRWLRHRALRRWQAGESCGYIPVLVRAKALVSSESADDPVVFSAAVGAEVTRDLGLLLASPPVAALTVAAIAAREGHATWQGVTCCPTPPFGAAASHCDCAAAGGCSCRCASCSVA
jgi:hypothetical protein